MIATFLNEFVDGGKGEGFRDVLGSDFLKQGASVEFDGVYGLAHFVCNFIHGESLRT